MTKKLNYTMKPHRPNKYGAKKTDYNGNRYDSKKEAKYAETLDWLLMSKKITKWERQQDISLLPVLKRKLVIDFVITFPDGTVEYHDVKGSRSTVTEVYKMKKEIAEHLHNIKIKEVYHV